MPLIILEGPDCSGKSYAAYLIKNSNHNYKIEAINFANLAKKQGILTSRTIARTFYNKIYEHWEYFKQNIVLDRSTISNHIYCKLYSPEYFEEFNLDKLELYQLESAKIYFLIPSLRVLKKRLKNHTDHKLSLYDLKRQRNEYLNFYNEYKDKLNIILIEKKNLSIKFFNL